VDACAGLTDSAACLAVDADTDVATPDCAWKELLKGDCPAAAATLATDECPDIGLVPAEPGKAVGCHFTVCAEAAACGAT
jgi:hypothetical protein